MKNLPYLVIWNGDNKEPITDDEITITFRKVSVEGKEHKYAPVPPFIVGTHNPELIDVMRQIASMYCTTLISSYEEESKDGVSA